MNINAAAHHIVVVDPNFSNNQHSKITERMSGFLFQISVVMLLVSSTVMSVNNCTKDQRVQGRDRAGAVAYAGTIIGYAEERPLQPYGSTCEVLITEVFNPFFEKCKVKPQRIRKEKLEKIEQ